MSLKRLLTICFLLFTLTGNAAWASADFHAEADNATAVTPGSGDQHDFKNGESGDCDDHRCHACAHFLGLLDSPSAWSVSLSSAVYLTADQQPLSHPLSPLFQPPIA